jgi:hypothetical protein
VGWLLYAACSSSLVDDITVGTDRLPNSCAANGSFSAQLASIPLAWWPESLLTLA